MTLLDDNVLIRIEVLSKKESKIVLPESVKESDAVEKKFIIEDFGPKCEGIQKGQKCWLLLLWDYYEYERDLDFLRQTAYPILLGAARFVLRHLFLDPESGYWMTGPSYSPENWFLVDGQEYCLDLSTTCDILLVREIFRTVLRCAELLSRPETPGLREIKSCLENLPPYRIGKYGQLQEWFHDHEEAIPNHRHTSHLLGVYPFTQIHPCKEPELAEAAVISLERRLTDHELTSWAGNMITSIYARLWKAEDAWKILNHTICTLGEKNLSIIMPPMFNDWPATWELDGNTGLVSAICEMFAQCSWNGCEYELYLLPALPEVWSEGEIKGMRLRGGFSLDLKWQDGKAATAAVTAVMPEKIKVFYEGKISPHEAAPRSRLRLPV